ARVPADHPREVKRDFSQASERLPFPSVVMHRPRRIGDDLQLFAGTATPALARAVARGLDVVLGNRAVSQFTDDETRTRTDESVRGADCFVIQSTAAPVNHNLMEVLVLVDALRRASAWRVNAVIPYFGYARQDKKVQAREPITAKLVANLMETAGIDRVITIDLHAGQIQGFFDVPVDHLTALSKIGRAHV